MEAALVGVEPEPVRKHGVRVDGTVYPVKQAFGLATGVPRSDFQSQTARRLLAGLGLEVVGASRQAASSPSSSVRATEAASKVEASLPGWPWEGHVQALFAAVLHDRGWLITGTADTATKARGVDVLARRDDRRLGAEVKGWPSKTYADVRRKGEAKKTQPTTQAGHWYAQAVMKALMLLDSHPEHESLVVLPDFPRYRELARRTRTGLLAATVHIVFVTKDGRASSETWSQ